jgi:hypothetical protein
MTITSSRISKGNITIDLVVIIIPSLSIRPCQDLYSLTIATR